MSAPGSVAASGAGSVAAAPPPDSGAHQKLPLGIVEFVALIALLTALNALAINIMLPALGAIGDAFAIENDNDRQLVVVVYLLSAGIAQLFWGPLMDRFGRRPILLGALACYLIGSLLCVVAFSYSMLLVARAFQGLTTAAARVAAVAIVRDVSSGRRMAELMSLSASVFMLVPILAPSVGQGILLIAPSWRWVFVVLLAYGLTMAAWAFFRIPETLKPENRTPLQPRRIASAYLAVVRTPVTLGYTLASTFIFAGFFGFISSSEQIFVETFHLGAWFPVAFGSVSIAMTAATLLNSRLVGRLGMRRLSHFAVIGLLTVNVAHVLVAVIFGENVWVFLAFAGGAFFFLGLTMANFNAIALEPLGRIAGTASAAFGFSTTTGSALLGGLIGRFYDGTATPVVIGLALSGAAALALVLVTEKGRLFGSGAAEHKSDA